MRHQLLDALLFACSPVKAQLNLIGPKCHVNTMKTWGLSHSVILPSKNDGRCRHHIESWTCLKPKALIVNNKMSPYDSYIWRNSVPHAYPKSALQTRWLSLPCCNLADLLKNESAPHDKDDRHIGNNYALTFRNNPNWSNMNYKSIGAQFSACIKNSYLGSSTSPSTMLKGVSEHILETQLNKLSA
jgi:hypothetical protein